MYKSICDQIWENPAYCQFYEIWVSCTFEQLCHIANPPLRPIACFASELEHFVHDRTTPTENEKLRSLLCTHIAFPVYYAWTWNQLNGLGWSHSKWMQRSSLAQTSLLITRASTSSMPKKLKPQHIWFDHSLASKARLLSSSTAFSSIFRISLTSYRGSSLVCETIIWFRPG